MKTRIIVDMAKEGKETRNSIITLAGMGQQEFAITLEQLVSGGFNHLHGQNPGIHFLTEIPVEVGLSAGIFGNMRALVAGGVRAVRVDITSETNALFGALRRIVLTGKDSNIEVFGDIGGRNSPAPLELTALANEAGCQGVVTSWRYLGELLHFRSDEFQLLVPWTVHLEDRGDQFAPSENGEYNEASGLLIRPIEPRGIEEYLRLYNAFLGG